MSRGLNQLAAVIVVLCTLVPWVRSRRAFPNEPVSVTAMYRDAAGDIQYYPLVTSLSRGQLTDHSVLEESGQSWQSFPQASLLPYAAAFAIFGPWGDAVADVAVALAYLYSVAWLFRKLGVQPTAALLAALALAMQPPWAVSAHLQFASRQADLPIWSSVWGMRFPRPYVTEVYFVLVVASAFALLQQPAGRKREWLWLAGSFALLLQGDMHGALVCSMTLAALVVLMWRKAGFRELMANSWPAMLISLVGIVPFVLRRMTESPDIPIRWGMATIQDWKNFASVWWPRYQFWCPIGIFTVTTLLTRSEFWRADSNRPRPSWRLAVILIFTGYLTVIVIGAGTGTTIQPHQFVDRATRLSSYLVLACTLIFAELLSQNLPFRHGTTRQRVFLLMIGTLTAAQVGYRSYRLSIQPLPQSALREDYFPQLAQSEPSYRTCLTELVRQLDADLPDGTVVAAFDHHVFAWWMSFRRGHWFLAEPFVSAIPDAELEVRLALLCQALGMNEDQFIGACQKPHVNLFWLGLMKSLCTRWHQFSPWADYSPEQQARIASSPQHGVYEISQTELQRLRNVFQQRTDADWSTRRLDCIVLNNFDFEKDLAPPVDVWQETFRNQTFRVYRRTAALKASAP